MWRTKYVVFSRDGKEIPVIFPEALQHAEVAHALSLTPISAGFTSIYENRYECYGLSTSLKLHSRPADAALLTELLGGDVTACNSA